MQSKQTENRLSFLKTVQWNKYMVYIVFCLVFIFFAAFFGDQGFLDVHNLINILRQTAMISIMCVAGTFVIAAGQIDLTVGAVAAMSAMIVSLTLKYTNSVILSVSLALLFGIVVGIIDGILVTAFNLPSFLATMGMMTVIQGLAMWITNTEAIPIKNDSFNQIFGLGSVCGVPVLVLWTVLFYIVGSILFYKAPFGKYTLATGGNEVSAAYSGVKTKKIKMTIFIMSGAFAAFAGLMYAGRMQAGRYSFGSGDEMSVIAAVVLGGTAMSGGTGSVIGAFFGSILMGMINNALILAGLSTAQQTIVKGLIIIFAVTLSNLSQKKSK